VFYIALAAVRVSSSYQCVVKHDAYTQAVYIKLTIAQVRSSNKATRPNPERTLSLLQKPLFKECQNHDFELVVKISKQLEAALKTKYGAQGDSLGKISTTNSNTNCILSAENEINQFEFLNKLKRQENDRIFFCLHFKFSTYSLHVF